MFYCWRNNGQKIHFGFVYVCYTAKVLLCRKVLQGRLVLAEGEQLDTTSDRFIRNRGGEREKLGVTHQRYQQLMISFLILITQLKGKNRRRCLYLQYPTLSPSNTFLYFIPRRELRSIPEWFYFIVFPYLYVVDVLKLGIKNTSFKVGAHPPPTTHHLPPK